MPVLVATLRVTRRQFFSGRNRPCLLSGRVATLSRVWSVVSSRTSLAKFLHSSFRTEESHTEDHRAVDATHARCDHAELSLLIFICRVSGRANESSVFVLCETADYGDGAPWSTASFTDVAHFVYAADGLMRAPQIRSVRPRRRGDISAGLARRSHCSGVWIARIWLCFA